jgi:hypothetical protein
MTDKPTRGLELGLFKVRQILVTRSGAFGSADEDVTL